MSTDNSTMFEAAIERLIEARPLLPMYTHLIVSALFPIYTGAHASLSRPSTAATRKRKEKSKDSEDEEEETVQKMEGLTASDAIVFPITAGLTLAGLYFLITRYGADMINLILGWYFGAIGLYSVGKLVNDTAYVVMSFVFPSYYVSSGKIFVVKATERQAVAADNSGTPSRLSPSPLFFTNALARAGWTIRSTLTQKYSVKFFLHSVADLDLKLTSVNIVSMIVGTISILYANLGGKPWWLTNLQGFGVCYSAMQFMSPTTFATGSLILIVLFFYDIWAVFFTPLMVTVATNLDQPIKLVFPKPDEPGRTPDDPPVKNYSMLGLGDIVLPGLMIGLALRFDLYMFYLKQQKILKASKSSPPNAGTEIEKAAYVPVTGHWGDRFWCMSMKRVQLPARLRPGFPKPYFTACMIGYVIGMLTTLGVMSVFQHAQPALLYLVPGVLISVWTTGLLRGELKHMWEFTEAITGEQLEPSTEPKATEKPAHHDDRSWWQTLWHELFGSDAPNEKVKPEKKRETKTHLAEVADKDECLVSFEFARHHPPHPSFNGLKPENAQVTTCTSGASTDNGDSSLKTPRARKRERRAKTSNGD